MSRSERKESSHLIRPLADDAEDVWMSTLREFQSAPTSGNRSKIMGVATTCDATGAANKLSSAQKSTEAGAFERITKLTCSSNSLTGEGREQNSRRSRGNEEIERIHFPATRAIVLDKPQFFALESEREREREGKNVGEGENDRKWKSCCCCCCCCFVRIEQ